MSKLNIYEVFERFEEAPDRESKINVLRENNTNTLRDVLLGAFNPGIKFVIKDIPDYKCEDVPPGMSYGNMTTALNQAYLFIENHPRVSPNLSQQRKVELLQQSLESLEEKEAKVFANMLMKDLKVKGLTKELVSEALPEIPL